MTQKCITLPDDLAIRLEEFNKNHHLKINLSQLAQERLEQELNKRESEN